MKTILKLGLLALFACSTSEPSLVIIHVDAQEGVRRASGSYTLRVEGREAGGEFREEFLETHQDWGRDFVLGPRDHDASRSYRVTLVAYSDPNGAGEEVARNVLVSGYVQSQTRRYELFLYDACQGVTCGEDQQCDERGDCLTAEIPPTAIPEFDGGTAGADCISPDMTMVTVGDEYSCALSVAGEVYCWGNNSRGQLGPDNLSATLPPTRIVLPGVDAVVKVQAGQEHVCALTDTGAVWCWGNNGASQNRLGIDGDTSGPLMTIESGAVDISVGLWHACAPMTNGDMQCWGQNLSGELGRTDRMNDQVVGLTVPPNLAATRSLAGVGNSCGYTPGAALPACWGYQDRGAVGAPPPVEQPGAWVHRRVAAADATSVLAMSATHTETEPLCRPLIGGMGSRQGFHGTTCAVYVGPEPGQQRLYCWGSNGCGQVGNGNLVQWDEPQDVARMLFPSTATDWVLGVGGGTTCVAFRPESGADRGLYCWGDARNQKLPGGVQVTVANDAPLLMPDVDDVSVGTTHICAVANGRVYCWGGNANNRAVFGADPVVTTPTCVPIPFVEP